MSYCNECQNHDACDTGCVKGEALRRFPDKSGRYSVVVEGGWVCAKAPDGTVISWARVEELMNQAPPSATGETSRWHRAFQHYFHDGAEDCRQCGLPRSDRIHEVSASTDGGTAT